MLSELLIFFTKIYSLILRGNAHISKNFLSILFLGATISTKIFHEYGSRYFSDLKIDSSAVTSFTKTD